MLLVQSRLVPCRFTRMGSMLLAPTSWNRFFLLKMFQTKNSVYLLLSTMAVTHIKHAKMVFGSAVLGEPGVP